MRICPRLLAVLSGVAANCRKPWLIAACTLALSSLGLSEPARAQCSGNPDSVTCTTSGNTYSSAAVPANPYQTAAGIGVGTDQTPIQVMLQPGVVVEIPAGSSVAHAVALDNTSGGPGTGVPATLIANDAAITINTTSLNPPDTSALFVHAAGDATITASGV